MTFALITYLKGQKKFLNEWVNYNLNLGFNHIYVINDDEEYVFDNDNVTTLHSYVDELKSINELLNEIDDKYDYLAVCDVDEFFDFKGLTLEQFVQEQIIDKGHNVAELIWETYTDNNIINSIDKPIQELYTEVCNNFTFAWCSNEGSFGKSIFKAYKGVQMENSHWPKPSTLEWFSSNHVSRDIACVKHYRTKCLEDYLIDITTKHHHDIRPSINIIKSYFDFNELTKEKIAYIKQWVDENNIRLTKTDTAFLFNSEILFKENVTCALLVLARDEDKFFDEFIDYHLNLGFDHIYICDNNDPDKKLKIENPKVTICDYTHIDFAKESYYRSKGPDDIMYQIYGEVIDTIWDKYDYLGVIDVDEFFDFKGLNLKEFIKKELIDKGCSVAHMQWMTYTDNGHIRHIDKPVRELYTEVNSRLNDWHYTDVKSIFRLNKGVRTCSHFPDKDTMTYFNENTLSRKYACTRHYRTKCLEDYLEHKVKFGRYNTVFGDIIKMYFHFNNVTKEKIDFINQWLKDNNYQLSENDREFLSYFEGICD